QPRAREPAEVAARPSAYRLFLSAISAPPPGARSDPGPSKQRGSSRLFQKPGPSAAEPTSDLLSSSSPSTPPVLSDRIPVPTRVRRALAQFFPSPLSAR